MTAPSAQKARVSTRLILTAAVIGIACGIAAIPTVYLQLLAAATVPILYTVFVGTFVLGPIIAQATLRRGGAAVIAAVVAGLATAPFTPRALLAVVPMALLGGLYELTFGITLYRVWPWWRWFVASAAMSVFSLIGVWIVFDLGRYVSWVGVTAAVAVPASFLGFTWIGLTLAGQLRRTGVGRIGQAGR